MKPYSTTKTASVICTATHYTELGESHTALELAYQDLTRLRAQNAELVAALEKIAAACVPTSTDRKAFLIDDLSKAIGTARAALAKMQP